MEALEEGERQEEDKELLFAQIDWESLDDGGEGAEGSVLHHASVRRNAHLLARLVTQS